MPLRTSPEPAVARVHDARQCCCLDIRPHDDPVAFSKHDLHLAGRPWSRIFRRRVRRDRYGQDRREFPRRGRLDAELPTPG